MVDAHLVPLDPHSRYVDSALGHVDGGVGSIHTGAGLIVVCFTNRSGSTWVCSTLRRLGLAGPPSRRHNYEHLNQVDVDERLQAGPLDSFEAYLADVIRRRRGPRGYTAFKASPEQLNHLIEHGSWAQFDVAPTVLFVRRRNVIRQAISMSIALQDQRWTSQHEGASTAPPVFNADEIMAIAHQVHTQNARFELLADAHGLRHHTLVYEDLLDSPQAIVRRLAGIFTLDDAEPREVSIPLQRQPQELKDDWERRIRMRLDPAAIRAPWPPREGSSDVEAASTVGRAVSALRAATRRVRRS